MHRNPFLPLLDVRPKEFLRLIKSTDFFSTRHRNSIYIRDDHRYYFKTDPAQAVRSNPAYDLPPREAAIMYIVYESPITNEIEFLFVRKQIQNPAYSNHPHVGEMCCVGGMKREHESSANAALREAREEVLFPESMFLNVVNRLPDSHVFVSNISVTPFIAILERRPTSTTTTNGDDKLVRFDGSEKPEDSLHFEVNDPTEIRQTFQVPLKNLVRGFSADGRVSIMSRPNANQMYVGPVFKFSPWPIHVVPRIWGATARFLCYMFFNMSDRLQEPPDTDEKKMLL